MTCLDYKHICSRSTKITKHLLNTDNDNIGNSSHFMKWVELRSDVHHLAVKPSSPLQVPWDLYNTATACQKQLITRQPGQ